MGTYLNPEVAMNFIFFFVDFCRCRWKVRGAGIWDDGGGAL